GFRNANIERRLEKCGPTIVARLCRRKEFSIALESQLRENTEVLAHLCRDRLSRTRRELSPTVSERNSSDPLVDDVGKRCSRSGPGIRHHSWYPGFEIKGSTEQVRLEFHNVGPLLRIEPHDIRDVCSGLCNHFEGHHAAGLLAKNDGC